MPAVASGERTGSFQELRNALHIDKNDLDTCLVQQPDLFYRVSEEYTLARSLQDEIKHDILNLEAALGAQFRADASEDKKPPSVEAIKHMIAGTPKMISLQKEMLDASTRVGKWATLKESYEMRSSSLKSMTHLFAANYFTVSTGVRLKNEAIERGGDRNRNDAGEERRNREPRVRPRDVE